MKTPKTLICIFALTLLPLWTQAANLTWDANTAVAGGQDGSGTWDNSNLNWLNAGVNAAWNGTVPDAAFFGSGGAAGTVTLGANVVCGNITFNGGGAGEYAIAGGGFTLGLTNRTITVSANGTISANIVGTSVTLANSGGNAPSAVLTLSGANSNNGGFNLGPNAATTTGAVRVNSSTAFGTGTVSFNPQGNQTSHRIELTGGVTIANTIAMNGRNNISMGFESFNGANTLSGPINFGAGGGQYGFQVDGSSTFTLSGTTTIQANGGRNMGLRGTGNGTVSGILAGGASNSPTNVVSKAGSGTWTLAGANTANIGAVVAGGTLALDYTTQNNSKLADLLPLYLSGGAVSLGAGSHLEIVSANTIAAGNSAVARSSGSSTLRLNTVTRMAGGTVDFSATGIADTDNANVNGLLGGYATVAGADWATVNIFGGSDNPIAANTTYTDINAGGGNIVDNATANVRLNTGGGGDVTLGSTTTTINTLLQNATQAATITTVGSMLRLGTAGGVLVPSGRQSLTIGNAVDAGVLTAGGADNTAGEIILINNSANGLTVNSTITDNGSGVVALTKAGSGSATLSGNNTHSGINFVTRGTLNISSVGNLGSGTVVINGGTLNATATADISGRTITVGPTVGYGVGSISVASGQTLTHNGVVANSASQLAATHSGIIIAGGLVKTGPGTLVLGGGNTYTFGTTINEGTLSISASGNIGAQPGVYYSDHLTVNGGTLQATASLTLGSQRGVMLGAIGGAGTGTFQVDDGVVLQLDSRVTDNWGGTGALAKSGNGTLVITSAFNDYSGDTTVSAGILQVNNARSIPNGAGKGNLTVNGTLNINGVSVQLNGLSGSGFVDNTTATAMTLGVGNNDQSSSFSGSIQNSGGGPLALSKVGSGTLTLANNNFNHNGSTFITAGTLALSGSTTMGNTTNIAVSAGATLNVSGLTGSTLALNFGQTLSGNGTVLGTINAGAGAIAPGASAGTLNVANVTLSSGSVLNYEVANVTTTGAGVNDYTVVSGTLNVAGPTTLNLAYLNGLPASSGKYTLMSYGTFAGNVNDISVPPGFVISNNTVAKTIELLISHVPTTIVWRGDGAANVWDINTTPNWIQAGLPQVFFNGDTANFDNSGSNTPSIFISAPVSPAAVNVNALQTYEFSGSSLSGATLNKSGFGTLMLNNDNTFSTGTTISGGTLQIGNGGSTGTLTTGNMTNNGTLLVNRTGDVVLNNAISGSGSVIQANSDGTLALSGSNSYSGDTLVPAGRLYPRNTAAFGSTSSGTTVSTDAQIYMDVNVSFPEEPLTLNGHGLNGAGDGVLRKGGAGVTAFGGPVTLGSDATISMDGGATLNLTNAAGITSVSGSLAFIGGGNASVSGPISLAGGGGILTKPGTGALTLGGSNAMSLATIPEGTLILANNNALGTNLNVVLTSTTGGPGLSGTRLTLAGGVTIPANRSLTMPSSGAGTIRSAFFGTGAGVTNTWAGTVTLLGDGSDLNNLGFGVDANTTFVIGGNVTADSTFPGKVLMRGNNTGLGIISGSVTLNAITGQVQVDDGTTWVFANSANVWATNIFANSSNMRLGVNNGLPAASVILTLSGNNNRLDLAGFNQQVAGMEVPGGGLSMTITNSSASADSTFTYAGGTHNYNGFIGSGARKLNFNVASGTLIVTNPVAFNIANSTLSISNTAVLQLDYIGTNTVNALVLNGISQAAGVYSSANASPFLAGTGSLLVVPGPSSPAQLTNALSGNILSLSWPAGQGWRLQAQTNSITTGISNNWVYVTDSSVSSTNITVNPANPTVFFRLRFP